MAGSTLTLAMVVSAVDRASRPLRGVAQSLTGVGRAGSAASNVGPTLASLVPTSNRVAQAMSLAQRGVQSFTSAAQTGLGAVARAASATERAFQAVGRAGESVTAAGQRVSQVGSDVSAAGQNIRSAIASTLAPATELEGAMTRLELASEPLGGVVPANLERVRAAALAWQRQHGQSASSYVEAARLMVRAGISQADSADTAAVAIRLASVTQTDAAASAQVLGVIYQQMGDRTRPAAAEIGRLGDVLVRAQQVSNIDLATLSDPLKDAIPIATRFRVSAEQTIGVIASLNAAGLQGGAAGGGFRDLVTSIQGASETLGFGLARDAQGGLDLVATLANINARVGDVSQVSGETAEQLQQAFGPTAFQALVLLQNQSEGLNRTMGAISNSTGAAAAAQTRLEQTSSGRLAIMQGRFEALKVQIADRLVPALEQVLPPVMRAVDQFSRWAEANPKLVTMGAKVLVVAGALTTVVGPVLLATGAVLKFGGALLTGIARMGRFIALVVRFTVQTAIPFIGSVLRMAATLTRQLLTAMASAAVGLVRLTIRAAAYAVTAAAPFILATISMAGSLIATLVPALATATLGALSFAAALLANPITWVVLAIAAGAYLIFRYWRPITRFFVGLWDEVKGAFRQGWLQGVIKVLELVNPLTLFSRMFSAAFRYLTGISLSEAGSRLMGTLWRGLQSIPIVRFATNIGRALLGWFRGFSLSEAGANIMRTLGRGISSLASMPVTLMRGVVQRIRNLLPFSPAKDGPLRDLHRVKLVETIASSVRPEPLVNAMRGVAAATMAEVPSMAGGIAVPTVGTVAPIPSSATRSTTPGRAARGGGGGGMTVHINLPPGTARENVDAIAAWFRNPANAQVAFSALEDVRNRQTAAELG